METSTVIENKVDLSKVLGESVDIGQSYSQGYLKSLAFESSELLMSMLKGCEVPESAIVILDNLIMLYLAQIELANGELSPITAHMIAYGIPELTAALADPV